MFLKLMSMHVGILKNCQKPIPYYKTTLGRPNLPCASKEVGACIATRRMPQCDHRRCSRARRRWRDDLDAFSNDWPEIAAENIWELKAFETLLQSNKNNRIENLFIY